MLETIKNFFQNMFEKIKKLFQKKNDVVTITITIEDKVFENVSQKDADEILKEISEKLKKN
jgi:deoxyadenosine/deoxycytidine kinase